MSQNNREHYTKILDSLMIRYLREDVLSRVTAATFEHYVHEFLVDDVLELLHEEIKKKGNITHNDAEMFLFLEQLTRDPATAPKWITLLGLKLMSYYLTPKHMLILNQYAEKRVSTDAEVFAEFKQQLLSLYPPDSIKYDLDASPNFSIFVFNLVTRRLSKPFATALKRRKKRYIKNHTASGLAHHLGMVTQGETAGYFDAYRERTPDGADAGGTEVALAYFGYVHSILALFEDEENRQRLKQLAARTARQTDRDKLSQVTEAFAELNTRHQHLIRIRAMIEEIFFAPKTQKTVDVELPPVEEIPRNLLEIIGFFEIE